MTAHRELSGKHTALLLGLSFFVVPLSSFAATFTEVVVFFVSELVNPTVILIIGFAVVYFFWGVAKYILHSDDAKTREEGRGMMIQGIIAIFVMISMWGLVNLLDNTFGLDNQVLPRAGDFLR